MAARPSVVHFFTELSASTTRSIVMRRQLPRNTWETAAWISFDDVIFDSRACSCWNDFLILSTYVLHVSFSSEMSHLQVPIRPRTGRSVSVISRVAARAFRSAKPLAHTGSS